MKTAVVFASKYGATKRCAEMLAAEIGEGATVLDLGAAKNPDISEFDAVAVGGPIYGGRILKPVFDFCEHNSDLLTYKRLGLFVCCFRTGAEADAQLQGAFPSTLVAHARVKDVFGGAVDFDKLGLIDRFVMKRVGHLNQSIDTIHKDRIQLMAESFRG